MYVERERERKRKIEDKFMVKGKGRRILCITFLIIRNKRNISGGKRIIFFQFPNYQSNYTKLKLPNLQEF